jgi:anti-anti-sigma factor
VEHPPQGLGDTSDEIGSAVLADRNLFGWLDGLPLHSEEAFVNHPVGNAMLEDQNSYVQCPVLVIRVTEAQVMGDTVADALRDQLLSLYDQTGATHAIIDMGQVTYLSSAGIRPLLALNREVREREGRLILCGLTDEVEGVFVATRLISPSHSVPATFECAADVSAAVAHLYPKV